MRAVIVLDDSSLESVTIVDLLAFVDHRTSLERMTVGFTVDEADYASIVSQVKNAEFEDELQRRLSEMMEKKDAEQKVQETLSKKNDELSALRNAKDFEIAELKKSQSILAKSQAELQKTAIKYEYEAKLKFAQEHIHGSRWQRIHILLPPYSQLFVTDFLSRYSITVFAT